MTREEQLIIIKNEYNTIMDDIFSYGAKNGWKREEIIKNHYLFLHLVIEFTSMFND